MRTIPDVPRAGDAWLFEKEQVINVAEIRIEHCPLDGNRYVCTCGADTEERYSLGVYAGRYCDAGWKLSGYRDEGREGFDEADAGESYEAEDY